MAMGVISDDAVRERAYHIWEREGRPHGRDFEHWVRAKVELVAEASNNNSKSAAAKSSPAPLRPRAAASAKTTTRRSGRAGSTRAARAKT